MFQHTAARRRLVSTNKKMRWIYTGFNTQPPEGGWAGIMVETLLKNWFQHTAARRRLVYGNYGFPRFTGSFNTQPPEGGWFMETTAFRDLPEVSTHSRPKAAGRPFERFSADCKVSTHSRPKAAGASHAFPFVLVEFQHTAARRRLALPAEDNSTSVLVSTHSRPKAAG